MSQEEHRAPVGSAGRGDGAAAAALAQVPQKPRDVPLPPSFRNDDSESFQLWARRYEVIQEARYRDTGVNLDAVMASELPTRLPPELFIVWDNLPSATRRSFASTKKHLQEAFGKTDVIASFQAFANSRSRKPGEAMEVYAADVCRLVKEAFPDFEPNAAEYMKLTRFLAGLDQELQIKCHERGVKTFKEAFDIASQAERARKAAKLLPPTAPQNSCGAKDSSVNTISDGVAPLHKVVQDLTDTVRYLSKDLTDLKLTLNAQTLKSKQDAYSPNRPQRSPSPRGRDQEYSPAAQRYGRSFSPNSHMSRRHLSPEWHHNSSACQSVDRRRWDYYARSRDRPHSPHRGEMPRDYNRYSKSSPDRHTDYNNKDLPRPHYDRPSGNATNRRYSPSPVRKRVSFQGDRSENQHHYRDHGYQDDYQQGNFG